MANISLPQRLYERSMPTLLADLVAEESRLSREALWNLQNQKTLLNWWLRRRSDVMSFAFIEPRECMVFADQLEGLVGATNFVRYRKYRNAYFYLVPMFTHTHLVKMMSGILSFKQISNRSLFRYRHSINGSSTTPLPWEQPDDVALECARRISALNHRI